MNSLKEHALNSLIMLMALCLSTYSFACCFKIFCICFRDDWLWCRLQLQLRIKMREISSKDRTLSLIHGKLITLFVTGLLPEIKTQFQGSGA